jgi:heme-degrading monooxygenase HmoA
VILEHAILNVRPGESPAFRLALEQALPLIAATPGFIRLDVRPCVETPDRYLLLVEWQTLEAHTIGFRGSSRYQQWRALLHHFYEPYPTVEHYSDAVIST